MLRPHCAVIKPCGNRMGVVNLAFLVLHYICECSMEYSFPADFPIRKPCRMFPACNAKASCLNPYQFNLFVIDKCPENADCIAASPHTCDDCPWKPAFLGKYLLLRLLAYD